MVLPLALCLLFIGRCLSVRMFEVAIDSDDCIDTLRPMVRSLTYRELFYPVFEGTYKIRNRVSDTYLTEEGLDVKGLGLNKRRSQWRLQRLSGGGMPKYSLQNDETRRYLVANWEVAETSLGNGITKAHWRLILTPDGVSFDIENIYSGDHLVLENGVAMLRSNRAGHSQWILEEGSSMGGRWFRERQYKRQWRTIVGQIPILPGSKVTWNDLCAKDSLCQEAYVAERKRHLRLGTISETERRVVNVNRVRGVCDWSLQALKRFSRNPGMLKHLQGALPDASCPQKGLVDFADKVTEAFEKECFASCVEDLRNQTDKAWCDRKLDGGQLPVTASAACEGIPSDTFWSLVDYVMMGKCFSWFPPSPLWVPKDHSPKDLASIDGAAVCTGTRKRDISRKGTCPEGTKCKCPRTYLKGRDTTAQRRKDDHQVFVSKTEPAGTTLPEAFLTPQPHFSFVGGLLRWNCKETLGCWPQEPEDVRANQSRRACRLPKKAQEGGSPVWFLPPPMLRLKHSWGKCVIDACKPEHVRKQLVGFGESAKKKYPGKPNVYNCQPLTYEEMTENQKTSFLAALLASGVFKEYAYVAQ